MSVLCITLILSWSFFLWLFLPHAVHAYSMFYGWLCVASPSVCVCVCDIFVLFLDDKLRHGVIAATYGTNCRHHRLLLHLSHITDTLSVCMYGPLLVWLCGLSACVIDSSEIVCEWMECILVQCQCQCHIVFVIEWIWQLRVDWCENRWISYRMSRDRYENH